MPESSKSLDHRMMLRAIALAQQGRGYVEPNPMVGCVVVKNGEVISEGYHHRFGQEHAEVHALRNLSFAERSGATLYVTLEPCSHFGKTPPCVELVIESKPERVVIGCVDPFPKVSGTGIAALRKAGIEVDVGTEGDLCQRLIAPFAKLNSVGMPWVIAKWGMTLDGRLATYRGDSQWITNARSRQHAHAIRGTLDAVIVGIGTVLSDNPMLTARPPGPRVATRIVIDSRARIASDCKLVETARDFPTLIVCGPQAEPQKCDMLRQAGCHVWQIELPDKNQRLVAVIKRLGEQKMTNILIEGGSALLGSMFDQQLIDEVHCYIGGKLVGGKPNFVPNLGAGMDVLSKAWRTNTTQCEILDGDVFIAGDLLKPTPH